MKERLLKIAISNKKNKKYDAYIKSTSGKIRVESFGDVRYQNYKDQTPIRAYSSLEHHDKERRKRYLKRHTNCEFKYKALEEALKESGGKIKPRYLSIKYLW